MPTRKLKLRKSRKRGGYWSRLFKNPLNSRLSSSYHKSCLHHLNDEHVKDQAEGVFRLYYPHAADVRTRTIRKIKDDAKYNPTFAEIVCGSKDTEPMVYSHKGPTYQYNKGDKKPSYRQQKEINKEFRDLIVGNEK